MASLQKKGDSWYCQFMYQRQRHTYTIGKVDETEAQATSARIGYLLMRVRQQLMTVPVGIDILTFLKHDGNPLAVHTPASSNASCTIAQVCEAYLRTMGNGALESNTLYTIKIQLAHMEKTLGKQCSLQSLELSQLQEHVERRKKDVCSLTIKKEINALRAAWNWACRMKMTQGTYPSAGIVYPKSEDKLPFMTFEEIQRRMDAGSKRKRWECLYLTHQEVEQLLDHVQQQSTRDWVYPAFVFAAHTGARRSELMRANFEDIDFTNKVITIQERKRQKGRRTSRRVPMSSRLETVLTAWAMLHGRRGLVFRNESSTLTPKEVEGGFASGVRNSKWNVMKGWHTLRHSFISALASNGVDQRLIDDFVGHQTEEQRRRYRHLYPSIQQEALRSVFG